VVTSRFLPDALPTWSGALRALPAGIVGLLVCRRLPRGAWIWKSLAMGLANMGVFFPLLFVAAYRLPGGVAAVLGACQPLFVAGLGWLALREPPGWRRIRWGLAAVAGVALMVLSPGARLDPVGIGAGVLGTASMAVGIVLTKKWGRPVGGFTWASWLLAWSGLALVPAAFALEGPPPPLDAAALGGYAWLTIPGGLLAYWAWFAGLARLSAGAASFLPLLSPVMATLLGAAVLGEFPAPVQWAGLALCLCAVYQAQRPPRAAPPANRKPPPRRLGLTTTDGPGARHAQTD
jgi:probable blue pigment (indigoidine) exporter